MICENCRKECIDTYRFTRMGSPRTICHDCYNNTKDRIWIQSGSSFELVN